MRPRSLRFGAAVSFATVLLGSHAAWAADRVAVLRFVGERGPASDGELEAARAAARDAVGFVHDTLPTDAELAAGEAKVTDGSPDTTSEYRAAGVAARATWTLAGHIESHGWTYRLELEACQVASGRVESLVREIDARQAAPQIAEMLALLLRPEGVGNSVPPWEAARGPVPVLRETPPAAPAPPPPTIPVVTPHESTDVGRSFGAGPALEVLGNVAHGRGASDSVISGIAAIHLVAPVPAVPGFALIVDGGAGFIGQTSLSVDLGASYLRPAGPSGHLFIGPELAFGTYFLRGAGDARLLSRGEVVFAFRVRADLDVELYPEAALAAGGAGSLWFAGGGARAVLRF